MLPRQLWFPRESMCLAIGQSSGPLAPVSDLIWRRFEIYSRAIVRYGWHPFRQVDRCRGFRVQTDARFGIITWVICERGTGHGVQPVPILLPPAASTPGRWQLGFTNQRQFIEEDGTEASHWECRSTLPQSWRRCRELKPDVIGCRQSRWRLVDGHPREAHDHQAPAHRPSCKTEADVSSTSHATGGDHAGRLAVNVAIPA